MKRLLLLLALVAFAACQTETPEPQPQPEPEPQPEVKDPILTLTSEATLEFTAEGGGGTITYTLENAVEETTLEATCEAEWVTNLTVGQSVTFTVAANDVKEARETKVVVAYGELSFDVAVMQAAKEVEPTPEPEPEPTYAVLEHLSGLYFGNQYSATEYDYNYSLALSNVENCLDIITGEVTILENSTYLFLDLYAAEPAENLNVSFDIPEGEYTLDTTNSTEAGTIGAYYSSLYITNEVEGVEILFVDGKVTVTADGIEAKLYDEAGNEHHYFCPKRGVDNTNNFGPAWAPGDQSTLTKDLAIEFADGAIYAECYGDYYVIGKYTWMYFIDDYATGDSLCFEILTDIDAEYPVGTFPISNDLNNKQMALPGYLNADGNTMWSWYYLYDYDYSVIGAAPIVGGEVTIVDRGDETFTVTIDVVDDLGYKISGECTAYGEFYGTRAMKGHRTLPSRKK